MASIKTAIIVGYKGQDGTLLARRLADEGYRIVGVGRNESILFERTTTNVDICDLSAVMNLLVTIVPDEIYYLAGYHSSSEKPGKELSTAMLYEKSSRVHVLGLINFLQSIVETGIKTRLFYAASSLIYSGRNGEVQDESTPFDPVGIYGITKAQGVWVCREYRRVHNIFATCGFLYNHESHLRAPTFLSAKIISAAFKIASGSKVKLELGNPDARVDWGYAPDYVNAFKTVLALDTAEDFIFATGETHCVSDFAQLVFNHFSLDWRDHVVINKNLLFRQQPAKSGNPAKLLKMSGVTLHRPLEDLVSRLIGDFTKYLAHND